MNVLIACEKYQVGVSAFRAAGHHAFSCDLEECLGGHPEWHIKDDCRKVWNGFSNLISCFKTQDGKLHDLPEMWDLVIVHPPCTYLSKAGARWLYRNGNIDSSRLALGLAARDFFFECLHITSPRLCVENPTPLTIFELPAPTQVIQPYLFDEFGDHPYSKRTLLWLKGLEPLKPTTPNAVPVSTWCPSNTSRFSKGAAGCKGVAHHGDIRNKSFSGIVSAMVSQWCK